MPATAAPAPPGTERRSRSRRTAAAAATAVLAATVTGFAPAHAAVEPGTGDGASVVKTGWWWAPHEAPETDQTVLSPPEPGSPNVPARALPVSAVGGEPEKISAIEFLLDAEPGSTVESFTLSLRETEQPGSNLNADGAEILACTVTEAFWPDTEAGEWKSRPEYDCDAGSAAGSRGDDGIWTFDLTMLAAGWPDAGGMGSVVLVEDVESPEGFHVVWDGAAAGGIGVQAVTTPPGESAEDVFGDSGTSGGVPGGTSGGTAGAAGGFGGGADPGGSGGSGTGSLSDIPLDDVATADMPVSDVPVDTTSDPAPLAAGTDTGAGTQVAPVALASPPPWYSGLSWPSLLLVPLMFALAYLAMLALGPDAQPVAAAHQRGVGRALDKLRRAGSGTTLRGTR